MEAVLIEFLGGPLDGDKKLINVKFQYRLPMNVANNKKDYNQLPYHRYMLVETNVGAFYEYRGVYEDDGNKC